VLLTLLQTLPHAFLVIVIVVVAWFVLKSLIKFAIWAGAVGLLIYLAWTMGWLGRLKGSLALP
jgi:hypothetical protein